MDLKSREEVQVDGIMRFKSRAIIPLSFSKVVREVWKFSKDMDIGVIKRELVDRARVLSEGEQDVWTEVGSVKVREDHIEGIIWVFYKCLIAIEKQGEYHIVEVPEVREG